MTTTQTVVDETKTPAQPGAEVKDARNDGDDLETLLAEFKTGTETKVDTASTTQTDTQPDVKSLMAEVQSMKGAITEVSNFQFKQDMGSLVKNVRGELDSEIFDDETVEAWIDGRARRDPRLQQAWLQRKSNPAAFERIAGELGKQFTKKFGKLPDKNATEDREVVAAAVRGASTKAPAEQPPNFSRMSNSEYRKDVQERYGFDPGV